MISLPTVAFFQAVNGQCTETVTVTLSAAAGWSIADESRSQVTVSYFGPKAYAYDLSLTIPGETVSSWSVDDETLLTRNLESFYNDPNLSFTVSSHTDVNGNLVVVVNVLGFSTLASATTSQDLISGGGLLLLDSAFASVTATASAPGISCSLGFSTTDLSSGCTIVNCDTPVASTGYTLGSGSTTFGSSYSMTCATGYSGTAAALTCQSSGSWTAQSGCTIVSCPSSPTQTGYTINSGTSTYTSTRTVSCATGYSGTASAITCEVSAAWTTSSGCTIVNCNTPVASTGYTLGSGSTTFGSSYSMTCDTGYSGTAAALTCQSSGSWTAQSGCTIVSCPSSPTQTGYTINSGASTYTSTRTVSCATGYSGTASAIACQASAAWTTSSGCTVVSCTSSPTQTGYTINSGSSTYTSTRTTSCASGYTGTGSSITCQASGAWTSATGCSAVATSCTDHLLAGSTSSGLYTICPDGITNILVYCDQSSSGGGWTQVMSIISSSTNYGYNGAVWTNSDDTTGGVPQPSTNADVVSRAFYKMTGTNTRLCMTKYDDGTWSCTNFYHSSATPRALANGGAITSSQATGGLLPSSLQAVTPRGQFAGACWHRLGWNHGVSSHGGLRLGFTADNDSSDSIDSLIGVGMTGSSYGAWNGASGFLAYPWGGSPSPAYGGLHAQIWFRVGYSCSQILSRGRTVSGWYPGVYGTQYCELTADGGGWTLLMTLASASQTYTYYDAVWTNTDIHPLTGWTLPDPTSNANAVHRAFYFLPGTQTRSCMTKYDNGAWSCYVYASHSSNTARALANGGQIYSTQGTSGIAPSAITQVTSRGAWAAGCWQRLGWQHGVSSHGGLRLGLSGDNDSSDSIDSYIGLGGTAGSCCGAYSAASGYLAYPWGGYPSPSYAPLQGQIWFK